MFPTTVVSVDTVTVFPTTVVPVDTVTVFPTTVVPVDTDCVPYNSCLCGHCDCVPYNSCPCGHCLCDSVPTTAEHQTALSTQVTLHLPVPRYLHVFFFFLFFFFYFFFFLAVVGTFWSVRKRLERANFGILVGTLPPTSPVFNKP